MKNPKQHKLLWTSLAVFAVACGGGALSQKLDGGQTKASLGLRVQAESAATTALTALVEAQNLTVTAGQACVEEIRLKLPKGLSCADVGFVKQDNVICEEKMEEEDGGQQLEAKIKISGPYLFDLVTGESTPSLADVVIPSGVYREIEFRFEGVCNLGEEISLVLNGSMSDSSNAEHPYELKLKFDDELEIESPTDIQVLEEKANTVFTNILLNQWFSAVDFEECIDDGDLVETSGVIEINEDTVATGQCEDIYEDLLEAIKDSFEFEDSDSDDDGVDDEDESDDDSNDDSDDDNGGDDSNDD